MNRVTLPAFLTLTLWCAVLSIGDIRTRRLPDRLTLAGAAAVLAYAAGSGQFTLALRGAGFLALPYLLVHLFRPAVLGAGDVKLAVGLGAAAALGGGQAWTWSAFAAPLFTAAAGAGALLGARLPGTATGVPRPDGCVSARHPGCPPRAIPHGPSMCAATLLGLALW